MVRKLNFCIFILLTFNLILGQGTSPSTAASTASTAASTASGASTASTGSTASGATTASTASGATTGSTVSGATGGTGSTAGGDCTDTISDCKGYECTIDEYKPLMCTFCKKTCGFCSGSANTTGADQCAGVATVSTPPPTAGSQCIDTATNCGATSYECQNSLYKPIMCKYCKKTCNLCNDPVCSSYFDFKNFHLNRRFLN